MTTRVETRAVFAQLVKHFFHLESGVDRLDQHRRFDRALRQAQLVLRHDEHIVPQARFEVRLQLWQIEKRAVATRNLLFSVVEHKQREIEDAAMHSRAVDQHMLLFEMPAARTHLQRRDLLVKFVSFAFLLQRQRAANRLA